MSKLTSLTNLYPVPAYDELINRNGVTLLQVPGDITLRDGDIATTRWGDFMLNDERYSALVRFVQFWRFNYPTLRALMDIVGSSYDEERNAEADLDAWGSLAWKHGHGPLGGKEPTIFQEITQRIDVIRQSRGTVSGSLVLVIGRALATLREDLNATKDRWRAAGQQTHGRSIGEIFEAAGNNFCHADEWLVSVKGSKQQMHSVSILSDFLQRPMPLDGSIRAFAGNVSNDVLAIISGYQFERLEQAVFAFASDLAEPA